MYFPVVRLGGIFKITSGGTPSRKNKDFYENGEIPWIKTGELKQRYINSATEYITNEGLAKSSAKLFPKRTVLVAMYGATIGSCSILDIEAATNQACAAFLPHDEVHPEYLYYFFGSIKNELIELGVGGAQPNISASILRNVEMPFPSLEIQKKIADILDCAQGLIDKRNEQIEILDEFLQSVFLNMFGDPRQNPNGWPTSALGKLTSLVTSGSTPRGGSEAYISRGVPLIRSQNVLMNELALNDVVFISNDIHEKMRRSQVKKNDVLLNITGASIGRVAVYRGEYEQANVNQHVSIIRLKEALSPDYLSHFMSMPSTQEQINTLNSGATRQALNYNQIKNFGVTIPPMHLQRKFEEIIQAVERQRELMNNALIQMENNFNSLMQRAFRGELFS